MNNFIFINYEYLKSPPNPNIKKPKWFPSQTTFIFDPNFSLFALSSQDFLNTKKHNTKTMDKGWIKGWDPRSLCEYFYYCWICFRNVLILQYYYNVLKCENYLSQHVFYVNSIMTIIYHIFKFDFSFGI